MLYKPGKANKMWDTWLYYHDGVHYLYHLYMLTGPGDGVALATSTDGVHFEEHGPIIRKKEDAEWLGTGSVWRAGGQFVMNFSELREGIQAVYFAVSDDLVHWERLGDEYRSDPDPRWYDNTPTGRWDCIWTVPRPDGGFWGYLTARPWSKTPGIRYESVGKVASDDGLHWYAIEPPVIEWGSWPRMNVGEVGAIDKIGDLYYLILGYDETGLGDRHASEHVGARRGMYTFVGDGPEGPFRADTEAYRLLTSDASGRMMTYFARFYPTPDGMLVNHHSISRSDVRWLAPLKRALVDDAGHLYLGYWEGNEALKGGEIVLGLMSSERAYGNEADQRVTISDRGMQADLDHGGVLVLFANHFDLERGVVIEADVTLNSPPNRWSGAGIYIEENVAQKLGTAFLAQTRGRTEIGPLSHGRLFTPSDCVPVGIGDGESCHFRVLLRRSLVEFYLRNRLVQCYSLPEVNTGRLGLLVEAGHAIVTNLAAWEMNL